MNKLISILATIVWCSCGQPHQPVDTKAKLFDNNTSVHLFEVSGKGWGYAIRVNGKDFIRQETVPVVQGHHVFSSQKDAEAVGSWVANRIKHNEEFSLSLPVLKSLMNTDNLE